MTEQTKPKPNRRYAREPQATNQTASSGAEQRLPAKNTTKIACVIALLKRVLSV